MPNSNRPLVGRTALVTGGAKRLGRATALALSGAGADVVVHFNRSAADAASLAEAIRQAGRQAWTVQADLSRPDQAEALLARAVEAAGPIQILINSASIFPADTIMTVGAEELLANIQIHAVAPLMLSRAFAAQAVAGDIINFLDARITDYDRRHAAYHLSKRMLGTLTRMLALELAPAIAVNAVAPGAILPAVGQDEDDFAKLASTNPLKRLGTPEEIARAVLFLLESRFITGQVIFVDGGRHMKGPVYG